MTVPLSELQRGTICLALYPFTPGFPLDVVLREVEAGGDLNAKLETYDSVEAVARMKRNEIAVEYKLRPVLLLQGGTSPQRPDVLVSRINSITDEHRTKRLNWVLKLENDIHPVMVMVGHEAHHGLKVPSYVNLLSIQPVNKQAILKRLGTLAEDEMEGISERLVRSLEIDVSAYVARLTPAGTTTVAHPTELEQPS